MAEYKLSEHIWEFSIEHQDKSHSHKSEKTEYAGKEGGHSQNNSHSQNHSHSQNNSQNDNNSHKVYNKKNLDFINMVKELKEVLFQERDYIVTENFEGYLKLVARKEGLIQAINDTIADSESFAFDSDDEEREIGVTLRELMEVNRGNMRLLYNYRLYHKEVASVLAPGREAAFQVVQGDQGNQGDQASQSKVTYGNKNQASSSLFDTQA